ncbi:unnamed protein product [Heterobilharzia americana]|nr:unnamed protein product [Heterobilharzia americana]
MRQEILYFYITLLRHGETTENKNKIIQGHLDTDLSDNGLEQAKSMRIYITQIKPDVVISSDLKRARFTAYEIVDPSVVEVESRLRERNFGSLTGRSWSEVQQFAESNFQTGQDCNGWRSVGGECTHELASRTQDFLLDLCSRSRDAPPMEEIISKYFSEFLKKNNADRHSSSSIYAGMFSLLVMEVGFDNS